MSSQSSSVFRALVGYTFIAILIALLDYWVGSEISLWVLYFLPVGMAAWNLGQPAAMLMLALCVCLQIATEIICGTSFPSAGHLGIAILSRTVAWGLVVWLTLLYRSREIERAFVPPGQQKDRQKR